MSDGSSGRRIVSSRARWFLGGLAAAAVVAAIGLGMWRAVDVSDQATPSPSITPSAPARPTPSPVPLGSVRFSYPERGWEIELPENFDEVDTGEGSASRSFLSQGEPSGTLTITLGSADGEVEYCLLIRCETVTVATLTEFGQVVFGDGQSPFLQGPTSFELDGEPALEFAMTNLDNRSGPPERYVIGMHNGRPLFLHFRGIPGLSELPLADVTSGFRFLDSVSYEFVDANYVDRKSALTRPW